MHILDALKQLRDDIRTWITNNLVAINNKIEENKINITDDGSDNLSISDSSGNVIMKVDAEGVHTTALTLSGEDVQTKFDIVDSKIDAVGDLVGETPVAEQISTAIANQPEVELPNITDDGSGEFNIADPNGNIIFKVDSTGAHTTDLTLNGESVTTKIDTVVDELSTVSNLVGDTSVADQIGTAIENHNHNYSDIDNAPNITDDGSGEVVYADSNGNIIAKIDADGISTTALSLQGEDVNNIIDRKVANLVDSAPDTLNTLNELAAALGDDPNFATTVAGEIGKKVDKVEGKGLSTNDYTNSEKDKLANASNDVATLKGLVGDDTVSNQISNAISTITHPVTSVNGKTGAVSLAASDVGAASSSHVGDSSHITSAERTTWNNKSDFSGSYNDLSDKPTIPTALSDLSTDTTHRVVTDSEKVVWNNKSDFSGDYDDLTNAPNIAEDESGSMVIADDAGNIIFKVDHTGAKTTCLTAQTLMLGKDGAEFEVVDSLDSDSKTLPLSAAQGKALKTAINSITTDIGTLGGGDMLTATYDTTKNGIVDNAERLEGHSASYFAKASDLEDLKTGTQDSYLWTDYMYCTNVASAYNSSVTNKKYVDDADAKKLSLSGGTMTGNINMGGKYINNAHYVEADYMYCTNVDNSYDTSVANKKYVDDAIANASVGGTDRTMVREFITEVNSVTYTVPSNISKIYMVSVCASENQALMVTFMFDYYMIQKNWYKFNNNLGSGVFTQNISGVEVTAHYNSGTITFSAEDGYQIAYVCGYY